MPVPAFAAADYQTAFMALLPRGRAWSRVLRSVAVQVLAGLFPVFEFNTARAARLIAEAMPTTTIELLREWELSLGLPDACEEPAVTLAQRRAAVAAKWAADGGQSVGYYIAVAAAFGFAITITEGSAASYAWTVHAPSTTVSRFQFGAGVFGDPFAAWGNTRLECLLRRIAPAHTQLYFAYGSGTGFVLGTSHLGVDAL